jgi:Mrp family chromosome partitioning ATPase
LLKDGLVEALTALAQRQERLRPVSAVRRRKDSELLSGESTATSQRSAPVRGFDLLSFCEQPVDNLWVMPAGQPVTSPVEILGSPAMKDFFVMALDSFEMIIVDSPPVVPVSDSLVLSQFVDGVVFVTSVRKTPRGLLDRGVEMLTASSARVLGLVVNRTPRSNDGYYSGRYGYDNQVDRKVGVKAND